MLLIIIIHFHHLVPFWESAEHYINLCFWICPIFFNSHQIFRQLLCFHFHSKYFRTWQYFLYFFCWFSIFHRIDKYVSVSSSFKHTWHSCESYAPWMFILSRVHFCVLSSTYRQYYCFLAHRWRYQQRNAGHKLRQWEFHVNYTICIQWEKCL